MLATCVSGACGFAPAPVHTPCAENGGTVCDGNGSCVGCLSNAECTNAECVANVCEDVAVIATSPSDGATGVSVASSIGVTFNVAMDPTTLIAQTDSGACSGSVQVSTDNFATCIGFVSAAPAMSGSDTVATWTPAPSLSYGSTYAIRVTTAAKDASGVSLATMYTSVTGFTTEAPPTPCQSSIVISQVYGGGGNTGATYKNDFVELHNRGSLPVDVTGWSIQYASATGTTWTAANMTPLTGVILPGGYLLVQEAAGTNPATALPTPDVVGTIAMGATQGKVALVSSLTLLTGACPTGGSIVDFVGYGAATCFEGSAAVPLLSNTTAALRAGDGCTDTNDNASDFTAAAPNPRNSASTTLVCACGFGTLNESNAPSEVDYCNVQFPTSLSVQASQTTPIVYGQVYETGVTETTGPAANVVAELGFGPSNVNPENQSGWQFFATTYNIQSGNNDEYQGSFVVPATAGEYRYAYRFSLDNGATWTYCDLNGAGSNQGLSFAVTQLPILTVTP